MLSDQDTGFENKARVRKLPLQVFTAPDAQKPETEKQNKKETEASLNADNDTYNGLECSQEQIELGLREKEKILEEARKEAAAIEQEAKEKAEQTGVSLLAFEVYASYIKSVARSFYSQLLLLWIPMRTKFPLCFLSAFFLILFLFPFIQILSTFLV